MCEKWEKSRVAAQGSKTETTKNILFSKYKNYAPLSDGAAIILEDDFIPPQVYDQVSPEIAERIAQNLMHEAKKRQFDFCMPCDELAEPVYDCICEECAKAEARELGYYEY